jgi:hypothetical protein
MDRWWWLSVAIAMSCGSGAATGFIRIQRGMGDGTLQASYSTYSVGGSSLAYPYAEPVSGDFDGDGWPDVASVNEGSGDVNVLYGACMFTASGSDPRRR